MDRDSTFIENELRELAPVSLAETFLERLDDAMMSSAAEVSVSEEKIIVASSDEGLATLEKSLRDLVPYGVPENMIARLDDAMTRWHEEVPLEEKVVSLHAEVVASRSRRLGLRSVAAVAFLGAGAALFSGGLPEKSEPVAERIPVLTDVHSSPVVFTPKDARSSVVAANDRGVVWTKNGQPLRCLELHMNNELQFVNGKGEKLTIEQPKRAVRFTPVKFD